MEHIGYQGRPGSNNHAAACHFAEKYGWQESQLVPLVTGQRLMAALRWGEVRFGVYAHSTAAGGIVAENEAALGDAVRVLDRYDVDVHHALFAKAEVTWEQVTAVASHPEALRECRGTLARLCPAAAEHPMDNTATAARALAEGDLPDTAAVLCSRELGESLGLTLLWERAEDLLHNSTTFVLAELKEKE